MNRRTRSAKNADLLPLDLEIERTIWANRLQCRQAIEQDQGNQGSIVNPLYHPSIQPFIPLAQQFQHRPHPPPF